ncbi:MAG: DUF1614 domain-containing protein [Eubacteriales bacterium]|jgi:uncharacterized membrane protein|nr:DUF1614 domain-containing protein [Bacillota bacterium]MBV1727816.1 DUF1614 domain-containing protein [Desulforudis sp.]MDQ7788440.1 DUF1614 domain-containing protein [Clostridia bacterium]MDZ4042130.1 DUF1614 domain-containing protein [Eubacteriales bacterium]MBU4532425.1 DUF1614 domain-containing protein [Bacillota bacterium]
MANLPIGLIALIIVSVLIYLGLLHRVLDRMRLTDKAALIILGLILVGGFIDLPLRVANLTLAINVGGALVPIGLAIYLIVKADLMQEKARAVVGALITGAVVFSVGTFLFTGLREPAGRFAVVDIIYVYPIVAAIIAYAVGRSRRAAWVAATMGVLFADVIHGARLAATGLTGVVNFGGAGAFDVVILAGILAVLLAEIVGEIRERLQGGPSKDRDKVTLAALKTPGEKGENSDEK